MFEPLKAYNAYYFAYFMIPQLMITDKRFKHMSGNAKILYGLMLNRSHLSIKNGWTDKSGNVFIYFQNSEVQESLNCSHGTAAKLFGELDMPPKGVGLIRIKNQGMGKPRMIFVNDFTKPCSNTLVEQTSKNKKSKICTPDFQNLDVLYNVFNNTEYSNTDSPILSIDSKNRDPVAALPLLDGMDKIISQVRKQIGYSCIVGLAPDWMGYADNIVTLITDMYMQGGKVTIAGQIMDAADVQARYVQLRQRHVEAVIERFIQTSSNVCNPLAYLRTALYNALGTVDLANAQEVRSMMQRYTEEGKR